MRNCLTAAACAALFIVLPAAADDKPPMPKVYQGMATQKGQWKVDILEGRAGRGADKKPPSMTLCVDNLAKQARDSVAKSQSQSQCKQKMVKDTASEAIVEMTCDDRITTVTTTRENDKTLVMQLDGKSKKGDTPTHMKMRYAYLGPCREGQGTISLDKNSEQCQKIRQQLAKMDPEKQCAKSSQREQCLQQMRAQAKQLAGMCS